MESHLSQGSPIWVDSIPTTAPTEPDGFPLLGPSCIATWRLHNGLDHHSSTPHDSIPLTSILKMYHAIVLLMRTQVDSAPGRFRPSIELFSNGPQRTEPGCFSLTLSYLRGWTVNGPRLVLQIPGRHCLVCVLLVICRRAFTFF